MFGFLRRQSPEISFAMPKDNESLSDGEWSRVLSLLDVLRGVVAGRERFVRDRGLAADVFLPGGNWRKSGAANDFFQIFDLVSAGDRAVIDRLRWYANPFTGQRLVTMEPSIGHRSDEPPPPDHESVLTERRAALTPMLNDFLAMQASWPKEIRRVRYPARLGEIGFRIDGGILNPDTFRYFRHLDVLWRAKLIEPLLNPRRGNTPTIVEIGAGHGGLAAGLLQILPQARYIVIDLAESLLFSGIYLSVLRNTQPIFATSPDVQPGTTGLTLIPAHFAIDPLAASIGRADLVINTASFGEMLPDQVDHYAKLAARWLGEGGALYESNTSDRTHNTSTPVAVLGRYLSMERTIEEARMDGETHVWRRKGG